MLSLHAGVRTQSIRLPPALRAHTAAAVHQSPTQAQLSMQMQPQGVCSGVEPFRMPKNALLEAVQALER